MCAHTHSIHPIAYPKELRRCHDDLKRAGADLDKQKGELDEERGTLRALKKASGEEKAELLYEISRLKEKSQKDKAELEKVERHYNIIISDIYIFLNKGGERTSRRMASF